MICPKCGSESEENYCMRCGIIVNEGKVYQMEGLKPKKDVLREDLELFTGKNKDKILNKSINFVALVLGPFWLFYRKCYLLGFILFLIESVFLFLSTNFFPILKYLCIIFPIFYLFFGNTIYILHARNKIKKVKKKTENISEKIMQKGDVSIIGAILITLFTITILTIMVLMVPYFIKDIHKMNDMILISHDFVKDEKTNFLKAENACYLDAGKVKQEGEVFLYNYYGIEKDFSNLEKVIIGTKKWYTNKTESREKYLMNIYLYKKGKDTYIARFFSNNKENYNKCKKYFEKAKNRIYIIGN